ncbi:sentrin-specific protease 7 isoform X1 [Pygocentrus nattereri]|uniref:sentrin-specific protease 7 isoform X1 n=1 Tax=Pygocentrus nattereri TaxID=42514 RepID=UPI000814876C|nr:sentrin-specific protease 7 isoform X1 [Pygocentrus nattereri]XP_017562081.1 sentrin-specific protease 7 isoform X1 [Pygocentrus nattereri]
MPHDKTRAAGGVTLDRRRALTITAMGKLDSCRSADPFKIPKRRVSGEGDRADADVAKCARKYPKIHWSQLASSGASSQPNRHHNGSQTVDHYQNDLSELDINSRQVKVILTDVLQTEEGRRYLSSCGRDSKKKCQTELKRGARERRSDGRLSAERRDRRSSPVHNKQLNSPSSKGTESASTEENDIPQPKETKSPLPKRLRRFNNSLKQTEPTTSDENESCSLDGTVFAHIPVPKQKESRSDTEENESYPLEQSDSAKCTSASPLNSDGTNIPDDKQISECIVTDTRRHTSLSLSRHCHRMEHSGSEVHSTQHNTSKRKIQESAKKIEEEGKNDQEKVEAVANGEMIEEGGARGSVLRLSLGAVGDQLEMTLADGEVPPKRCEPQSTDADSRKVSKLNTPEPIILSSEDEDEEEKSRTSHLQTLEGVKDPQTVQRLALTVERKKTPDPHTQASEMHNQASGFVDPSLSDSPVIDLQFSALYMEGLSALSSGLIKIAHDRMTISLKDPSGTEVIASLATAHVRKYSVWEGLMVQDSALVKQNETPPPSLLLLWLSEAQARRLFIELSVIQPGLRPAEGSVCVLLCVSEPLKGIEGALLASIMDIVGLKRGTTDLLSPLTHSESMKLLQSGRDTQLLQLLRPRTDTHASSHESVSAPASAGTTTTPLTEPDVQANSVYTLCHRRAQGSYNVSMATGPGLEWTAYRHRGPARRLIQFPPPPCKGAITVTTEDLECLDSGEFLNDVIIDFYLKYLLVQKAPRSSAKRSHVFSSFFYKQLTRRDNANEDSTSTPAQLRRHQRVRTWTRHVDIFEKDFLFVPVNQEAHWYLVVVCFPGMDEPQLMEREGQDSVQEGTETSSDSMVGSENQEASRHHSDGDKSSDENSSRCISTPGPPNCTEKTCKRKTVCKRPCILIMDSLKLSVHERIFKLLREYLQVEWEVKRGGQRDFSAERMVGSHCRVPLQDNSSDCGLYLLQYAESFLQDPVVHFDLPLRLECWFPRQQVREKREEIRDLVLHLYRFQQGSLGNEGSEDKIEIGNVVQ